MELQTNIKENVENGTSSGKKKLVLERDKLDIIMGSFGRYHVWLCALVFLSKVPIACHQMAILFLAPKTTYTCGDLGEVCPCPNPTYNTSIFTNTIVMRWDLICDKKWLTSFAQTTFQMGTLLGSVIFGMASDRFGRRMPMLVAVVMQVSMGILAAYLPDYWSFIFVRFVVGLSVGGTMVIGFVIVMEFVGTKYRDIISAAYQLPFNIGHLMLPMFAYFFRDYTQFQLAISLPTIILLSYFFLLPETPRWLIAAKQTDKAIEILEKVARVNRKPTENIKSEIEAYQVAMEQNQLKRGTILDLFRTPNIRKHTLAMAFNWLACSYCFYGVSQYVGQLSGNVFLNVAASAGVTIIGTGVTIVSMRLIGRRTLIIVFNFICAGCLLALAGGNKGGKTEVVLACIGVVSSFIVFVTVYLYCSELFPTVVRNAALGFSSMSARIGSMVAPFVLTASSKGQWLPPVLFAIFPLIAGIVAFTMPETKGKALMTTIEEGEAFGKKVKT